MVWFYCLTRWHGEHSIMLNVTWRRFDQSAKQLVVGHATKNKMSAPSRPAIGPQLADVVRSDARPVLTAPATPTASTPPSCSSLQLRTGTKRVPGSSKPLMSLDGVHCWYGCVINSGPTTVHMPCCKDQTHRPYLHTHLLTHPYSTHYTLSGLSHTCISVTAMLNAVMLSFLSSITIHAMQYRLLSLFPVGY